MPIRGWLHYADPGMAPYGRSLTDGKGDVIPDSISIVDADPPNIFNRSAIRAAVRFKFQPRVQGGEGVDVPGVQYLFRWTLEDDDVQA